MGDQEEDPKKAALRSWNGALAQRDVEPDTSQEQELVGRLRRLVTRLREAELLMMRRWIEDELRILKHPPLWLVKTPSHARDPLPDFDGSFVELMGVVRHRLHELPEDRLIVLHVWVTGKLHEDFGHD